MILRFAKQSPAAANAGARMDALLKVGRRAERSGGEEKTEQDRTSLLLVGEGKMSMTSPPWTQKQRFTLEAFTERISPHVGGHERGTGNAPPCVDFSCGHGFSDFGRLYSLLYVAGASPTPFILHGADNALHPGLPGLEMEPAPLLALLFPPIWVKEASSNSDFLPVASGAVPGHRCDRLQLPVRNLSNLCSFFPCGCLEHVFIFFPGFSLNADVCFELFAHHGLADIRILKRQLRDLAFLPVP
eukprot:scaffold350_cov333-Pavlova_lutheri.AAC.32